MSFACAVDMNMTEMEQAFIQWEMILGKPMEVFNQVHSYVYPVSVYNRVFNPWQVLCVLGVLANIAIIVVLLRPAMRKNPFNMFLVAIAICDMVLMAAYLVMKHVERCHPLFFEYGWLVFTKWYAMFSVYVHSSSLWLTVNMAVLRFLVLKRGSSARTKIPQCNGYGAAAIAIVIAIITALIGSLPNMLRYEVTGGEMVPLPADCFVHTKYASYYQPGHMVPKYDFRAPEWWTCGWDRLNYWMAGILLKLIPCALLTVFMTLLVRMLLEARERRTRLCGAAAASAGTSQAERTTAMLTIIVAVFLLTELPQGLLGFLVGAYPKTYPMVRMVGPVLDMLSLLNSAVNFVLCALMSNVFRREFLLTFSACCPQRSENISGAKSQISNSRTQIQSTSKIVNFINSRHKAKTTKLLATSTTVCKNGFQPLPQCNNDEIRATAIVNGNGDHVIISPIFEPKDRDPTPPRTPDTLSLKDTASLREHEATNI